MGWRHRQVGKVTNLPTAPKSRAVSGLLCAVGAGLASATEVRWVTAELAPSVGDVLLGLLASGVAAAPVAMLLAGRPGEGARTLCLSFTLCGAWLSALHGAWGPSAMLLLWSAGVYRLDLRLMGTMTLGAWLAWVAPWPRQGAVGPHTVLVSVDGLRSDAWPALRATEDMLGGEARRVGVSPAAEAEAALDALLLGFVPWDGGGASLATQARERGCATGAFVSRAVRRRPGFDVYDDALASLPVLARVGLGRVLGIREPEERPAWETVAGASRWLRGQPGCAFAWVHLADPLAPLAPPPPWDQRYYGGTDPRNPGHAGLSDELRAKFPGVTDPAWVRAQYDGEVGVADEAVATLMRTAGPDARVAVVGIGGISLASLDKSFGPETLEVPVALRGTGPPASPVMGLADVYDWLSGQTVEARPWALQGSSVAVRAAESWRTVSHRGVRETFPTTDEGARARRRLLLDVEMRRLREATHHVEAR